MANMVMSPSGLKKLTESFESCKLTAYYDSKGVLTIGWGHTGSVYPGQVITQDRADELLRADISTAENGVNRCIKIALTQGEFDALVDFAYNVGVTAFCTSHLCSYINLSQWEEAAQEFEKWDLCGGKPLAGLLRRRIAERTLFEESEVCQ